METGDQDLFGCSPNLQVSKSPLALPSIAINETLSATQIEQIVLADEFINSAGESSESESENNNEANANETKQLCIKALSENNGKNIDTTAEKKPTIISYAVNEENFDGDRFRHTTYEENPMHSTLIDDADKENAFASPDRKKSCKATTFSNIPAITQAEYEEILDSFKEIEDQTSGSIVVASDVSSSKSTESSVEDSKYHLAVIRNLPPKYTSANIVSLIQPFFPTMRIEAYVKFLKFNCLRMVGLVNFVSHKDLQAVAQFLDDKKIVYENSNGKNTYRLRCDMPVGKVLNEARINFETCRKDFNDKNSSTAHKSVPFSINTIDLPKSAIISINNLPPYFNKENFFQSFIKFQEKEVKDYMFERSQYKGEPSGTGYIHFKNKYLAAQAISLFGPTTFFNRKIFVQSEELMTTIAYKKYNIPSDLFNLGPGIGPKGRFLTANDFDDNGNLKQDIR